MAWPCCSTKSGPRCTPTAPRCAPPLVIATAMRYDAFGVFETFQSSHQNAVRLYPNAPYTGHVLKMPRPKASEHLAEGFDERVLEIKAWRLWVRAYTRRQVRTARTCCNRYA